MIRDSVTERVVNWKFNKFVGFHIFDRYFIFVSQVQTRGNCKLCCTLEAL